MSPWREEVILHCKRLIESRKIKKVLELGCDDGEVSLNLAKSYNDIYFKGIDYRKDCIDIANDKVISKNIEFSYEYFLNINDFEEKFDIVILSEVYEHLIAENQMLALRIVGNLLKDNGYIIFTIPNPDYIFNDLESKKTFSSRYHESFFDDLYQTEHWLEPSYSEIEKIFVSLGYDIVEHGFFNLPKNRYHPIKMVEKYLKKAPFLRYYLLQNQYLIATKNPDSILLKGMDLF